MRLRWMLLMVMVIITTVLAKERLQKDIIRSKRINRGEGHTVDRKRGARNQVVNTAKVTLKDDPKEYDTVELMHQGQNVETETQSVIEDKCKQVHKLRG